MKFGSLFALLTSETGSINRISVTSDESSSQWSHSTATKSLQDLYIFATLEKIFKKRSLCLFVNLLE